MESMDNTMNFDDRPSPQDILEAIKLEEAQRSKGRLKIFLGMAAGVGKTYAMLEEARTLKKEQINVFIGTIESHGRKETEILIDDLFQVPKKILFYKEKEFKEMDIDAIISLHPSVVLVDELAHSNIPGSKHEKRWQDVIEILDHGINVYTTLNVQHIDSLSDTVAGITEITVRETIPDMIIEKAHSIQLIDLTPDELLQRLKEGKVYTAGQSEIAIQHFFQKNKLTALREIVLRYVADKIDIELSRMITTKDGKIEWRTKEKFLVAISHNRSTHKLIRATRRLANRLNAFWMAVYVNTGKTKTFEEMLQLEKNFKLVHALSAEVFTINDPDIAKGIKRVAFQRGITQIILGRRSKSFYNSFFQGPTLINRLSTECRNVDIHVIRENNYTDFDEKKSFSFPMQTKILDYFSVSLGVSLIGLASFAALSYLSYRVVEFLFFISVSALSIFFKKGPIILAAILFFLIWSIFFIPELTDPTFMESDDLILLLLYILTVIGVSFIADKFKQQFFLNTIAQETSRFEEILSSLDGSSKMNEVLEFIEAEMPKILDGTYKFVVKTNGLLKLDEIPLLSNPKELNTALWSFENGQKAGWSTETLPFSENLYIPLSGPAETLGILIYRSSDNRLLTLEEQCMLDSLCKKVVQSLEKRSG